jgi:hypothetical protein
VTAGAAAGAWRILTATQRGASHHALGLPNQDAVAACETGPHAAVAVADGHGHHRHFRSQRGARLAVAAACQAVPDLIPAVAGLRQPREVERAVGQVLVPAITRRWREAVGDDLTAEPITPEEELLRNPGDEPVIAYGTTLLVAAVWGDWLLLAQIGDGDIVGIRAAGGALLPVPGDPLLDGRHTTSLCSPAAERLFRVAAVNTAQTPLLGVLLATDGYGNAQASQAWEDAFSADLAELISAQPHGWLAGQLPLWAARCASADGSADDTTVALLLAPGAEGGPSGTQPGGGAGGRW